MKIAVIIFGLVLVLLNFKACKKMDFLVLDIDVVERGEDYYLLAKVENRSEKDLYISHWYMYDHIRIYNNENVDLTTPLLKKEWTLQTRFRKPVFNSKESDFVIDYEELFYEPVTLRKKLIVKAIDEETDSLLNLDDNYVDSLYVRDLKEILFWKYKNCQFVKAGDSFIDSTTITSLYTNSEKYKLVFSYKPFRDETKVKFAIDEYGNTVEFDGILLKKIDSYYLFENCLKDSLIINDID